jgi:hypothetical protein
MKKSFKLTILSLFYIYDYPNFSTIKKYFYWIVKMLLYLQEENNPSGI